MSKICDSFDYDDKYSEFVKNLELLRNMLYSLSTTFNYVDDDIIITAYNLQYMIEHMYDISKKLTNNFFDLVSK